MKSSAAVVASTAAQVVQTSRSSVSPSSSPAQPCAPVDPLEVFRARCDARAHLFVEGVLDLHEAVDELQASAERDRLIDLIGQDGVQAIMGPAFAARRWPQPPEEIEPEVTQSSSYRTPSSTIAAFWVVVQRNDPDSLRAWLLDHSADAPTLLKLLESR